MALVDLLSLNDISLKRELEQLKKLKERFKLFWTNFHQHYSELQAEYPRNFIFSVRLDDLFIVKNLQSDHTDIFIGDEFVESLNDSVKIREKYLNELINEVEAILTPAETFEEWKSKQASQKTDSCALSNFSVTIPYNADAGMPKFDQQSANDFLKIMKSYFSEEDQIQLSALISDSKSLTNRLIFRGNGNQLADAFKQLIEANLITGCLKSDLEKWVAKNFLYGTRETPKEYTEGWVGAIISEDTKPCKSPIIEIRMIDRVPTVFPTTRNKRNGKY
ncbi:hypothetical protein [Pedobacter cryoconitis]|uniref:hypothetical protein n=1 Tax=Pedobacter cryoconitis TaxID=188932 RepID=UPI00161C84DC|nr:hypothetical protein [Pedobacter cryoconitis]MBB5645906.1 hypothetical protein [Pedobacter cryoconitis]